MEPLDGEPIAHDDWACDAVELVHSLTSVQWHKLLTHIFRTAAHVTASGDEDAAVGLRHDLISTIDLRADADVRAALDDPRAPERSATAPLDEALAPCTCAARLTLTGGDRGGEPVPAP